MESVLGIGGFFFRAKDPQTLASWYATNLGICVYPATDDFWMQQGGPTVLAPFEQDTEYFGRPDQQAMVNFRVADLDTMLAQLRAGGATVADEIHEAEYGRFGWATDPEGNRFELWQPAPDVRPAAQDGAAPDR
jgi:predicted enzyme related to lactoylglutathione lyase